MRLARRLFALHENRVADAVAEKRADVGRGAQQRGQELRFRIIRDR